MFNKIKQAIKAAQKNISELNKESVYRPNYRVIEIMQTEDEEFVITVQLINKNVTFNIKPEEILADNAMVDQFSPRDIRTLTYLGYLGINGPKYKILAQRLSQDNDKLVFALKKKGSKDIIIKTAAEIMKEQEILNSLNSKDAHAVGYTMASESIHNERNTKKNAVIGSNEDNIK